MGQGARWGNPAAAQGAVLVAAGVEAMRLVGFYYLPHKLQRSSELYGTLGIAAALLLWLAILARLIVLGNVLNARVRPAVCRDT